MAFSRTLDTKYGYVELVTSVPSLVLFWLIDALMHAADLITKIKYVMPFSQPLPASGCAMKAERCP